MINPHCSTTRISFIFAMLFVGAVLWINLIDEKAIHAQQKEALSADVKLLTDYGIMPNAEGLTAYLQQLIPNPTSTQIGKKLIDDLGSASFRIRELAAARLLKMQQMPLELLRKAAESSVLEIASRSKHILKHPRAKAQIEAAKRRPIFVAAVFRIIRTREYRDALPVILKTVPFIEDVEALQTAHDTVAALAREEHLPILRSGLKSVNVQVRAAAIRGLGNALPNAADALRPLLADKNPRIALASAHALAEHGDRSVLAVLVKLTSADDETIRIRSVQILRALTGRNFKLNPFEVPKQQIAQRAHWRKWLTENGNTTELNHPLRLSPLAEDLQNELVLHYTFDHDQNGKLIDDSKHKQHGSVHNAHRFTKGIIGKALEVTGLSYSGDRGGHVRLPFVDFSTMKQFTLTLWVKERGMSWKEGEAYVVFGADRGVGVEDSLGISHFNDSLFYRVGGAAVSVPFDNNDRNRWVHYAMTFRDGHMRGYKNGRLVAQTKGQVRVAGNQAALGRHWWGNGRTTSTRFIGAFDDLRVYQRALSPSQIRMLSRAAP